MDQDRIRALKRRLGAGASPEGLIASFRTRVVAEPALQGTDIPPPSCLALAAAADLAFTHTPLESLGEAARIPEFVAATRRWMDVLARDGVEAALAETARCT